MRSDDAQPVCDICGRPPLLGRSLFRLPRPEGTPWHCERCAVRHPRLVQEAAKASLVIGTLLALINHGSVYWTGPITTALVVRTALTYCVPFGVSMWGALTANRGCPTVLAPPHSLTNLAPVPPEPVPHSATVDN
jgi:hypothetical protein